MYGFWVITMMILLRLVLPLVLTMMVGTLLKRGSLAA
jgi:hypothetical protein